MPKQDSKCNFLCVCSKGALVVVAAILTGFCSYAYISWFLLPYLFIGLPNMNYQPGTSDNS